MANVVTMPSPSDRRVAQSLAEWLLVEAVPDLLYRARDGATTYERLGIASIIRRTLTDSTRSGGPVLHQARERLSLQAPRFTFTPMVEPVAEPDIELVLSFIGPRFAVEQHEGGLEDLLRAPVAFHRKQAITMNELNRYFAHVHGGVHIGAPESEFEALVQRVTSVIPDAAWLWTATLSGFATVVARGLQPLVERINENPLPRPPG